MICVPRFYPGAGPAGGGGAAPDVTVATFADLPTTRPDGYLVAVTGEADITDAIVIWDDVFGEWKMERGYSTVSLPVDGLWYVGPPGTWKVSTSTVALVTFAGRAYEWTGLAWQVIEVAGPPLYILVNSFVAPDYPATTSAVYQTFTTVVTVDP
jgi:hypothetical protein